MLARHDRSHCRPILCLTALLAPVPLPAAETRTRSIPVLDQSEAPAMCSDGDGNFYPPPTALKLIADRANRPIIVAAETSLEPRRRQRFRPRPRRHWGRRCRAGASDSERRNALEHSDQSDGCNKAHLQLAADGTLERQRIRTCLPGSEILFREPSLWGKIVNGRAYPLLPPFWSRPR